MELFYNQKLCEIYQKNSNSLGFFPILMRKNKAEKEQIPRDISPKDDAFHGSTKHIAAEWWYFDAMFTNNYSIHIGCRTFSKKSCGIVSPFLEIYRSGKLEVKGVKRYSFRTFQTSKYFPIVRLANTTLMDFDQRRFKEKKEWIYHISLNINEMLGAELTFSGTTKGWKYETDAESWTVALPKATVTGTIMVNSKKINVVGIGYHDHNWNYTLLSPLNYGRGWYWGKIMCKTFSVSWANIMKTSSKAELIAVINQDGNGYYPINPKNIYFKPKRFIRRNRRKITTRFIIKINDVVKGTPIQVDVKMEAHKIHYNKVLIIAPYWRYHVKSTGFVSLNTHKEMVKNDQIMEMLLFG